jgi:hypothetical protein
MEAETSVEKMRGKSICQVLKHPLRVRILEILNEGPKSPSQFVEEGLVPEPHYETYKQALSLISYHFRELEKEGCLRVVRAIPRRGALEHVYEGTARVYFTDEEFDQLPHDERRQFSRISFQGLVARAEGAMLADTFDSRSDRHLTWMACGVDEPGWDELMTALSTCFGEVERIRHDSADRLAGSGRPAINVTFGMVGFESPPPPPLPEAEPSESKSSVGRGNLA